MHVSSRVGNWNAYKIKREIVLKAYTRLLWQTCSWNNVAVSLMELRLIERRTSFRFQIVALIAIETTSK